MVRKRKRRWRRRWKIVADGRAGGRTSKTLREVLADVKMPDKPSCTLSLWRLSYLRPVERGSKRKMRCDIKV